MNVFQNVFSPKVPNYVLSWVLILLHVDTQFSQSKNAWIFYRSLKAVDNSFGEDFPNEKTPLFFLRPNPNQVKISKELSKTTNLSFETDNYSQLTAWLLHQMFNRRKPAWTGLLNKWRFEFVPWVANLIMQKRKKWCFYFQNIVVFNIFLKNKLLVLFHQALNQQLPNCAEVWQKNCHFLLCRNLQSWKMPIGAHDMDTSRHSKSLSFNNTCVTSSSEIPFHNFYFQKTLQKLIRYNLA